MATRQHTVGDRLATGNEALARGAWEEARGHFEASLAESPSAEAYEGLSWATWWLDDADGSLGARERAFRAYRAAGKPGAAGRMAAWLSADHRDFRGDDAVGQGWLNRARRLLADLPEGPDHGWLAVMECNFAQYVLADLDAADRAARTAARIGREHGVPDLESIGLAQEGTNHVLRGRIDEGMRCLDEAAVIAAGEDLQLPLSPGWTVCCMISACDGVGDFHARRALVRRHARLRRPLGRPPLHGHVPHLLRAGARHARRLGGGRRRADGGGRRHGRVAARPRGSGTGAPGRAAGPPGAHRRGARAVRAGGLRRDRRDG